MTSWVWVGRSRDGRLVGGERAAASATLLAGMLRREDVFVTRMTPVATSRRRRRRVRARDLAVFTRQFAAMTDAGLPLVQCLDLLAREEPNRLLSGAVGAVRRDVEAGAALADAMRRQPVAFDALYTSLVAAGEAGGALDLVLKRLALFLETQAKMAARVRSAMMYPVSVLGVAVIVVLVMLWKVVPMFSELFAGLNVELPLPTRAVIASSRQLVLSSPMALAAGGVAVASLVRYYRTDRGRLRVDRMLLGTPLVGTLLRKVAVARFCRTLSTLMTSGVPILTGLDITGPATGNAAIERAVASIRAAIERGESIAGPLRVSAMFPPMVVQMVGAGEQTGALDAMLAKIADVYEDEVDVAVSGLLTLLEPALVVVLGVVVGAVVISMYLPLFELINQLS